MNIFTADTSGNTPLESISLDNAGRLIGGQTVYLANRILDHVFGKDSFTPPDTLYVGLWEVPITTQFTGSSVGEVMAGSYARVAVSNTFISWSTAGSGSKMIETQLDFPEAVENWGTVTHFAVLDAAVAGNMYVFGALASPKLVNAGDTFRFNQESIIIRID